MYILYSFILNKIDYFINIWGWCFQTSKGQNLKDAETSCKDSFFNMVMDTPSASMFNELKWMTVYHRVR